MWCFLPQHGEFRSRLKTGMLTNLAITFLVCISGANACHKYSFAKEENVELKDHVITTVTTPYVELCWDKCVWIGNCLSINVRKTRFNTVECDMNNSSKEESPGSLVPRQGSQYHQYGNPEECKNECMKKRVLSNGWYENNGKAMKLFLQNKTQIEARAHCRSLGGDLVSISTALENVFVHKVPMRNFTFKVNIPGIKHLRFDGTDPDIFFRGVPGAVRYEDVDGVTALYVSGIRSYVKVPATTLNAEGFTLIIWFRPAASYNVYREDVFHAPNEIRLYYRRDGRLFAALSTETGDVMPRVITPNVIEWKQVIFSWNKTTHEVILMVNGQVEREIFPSNTDMKPPIEPYFWIGVRSDGSKENTLHGHIQHLMIFNRSMNTDEMTSVTYSSTQGPWIGFDVMTGSKVLQWMDGSETKFSGFAYDANVILNGKKGCVIIGENGKWVHQPCNETRPFICAKPLP